MAGWYLKYYHEFEGLDKVLNKFEIYSKEPVNQTEIKAADSPFILEYPEVKKLEAVQSSGAKLKLISEQVFQFLSLHTDDMQGYMIKFYRDKVLYWLGYLDSELYEEELSNFPPYPVSFSGSDFNILERLKFLDDSDNKFTDINTLLTQLKRCFNKLELPFQKLYIGCSTVAEGVTLSVTETVLHKLYIQSSNFYDEDGEPMSCREVIESILEPFGLMMIQREANVYIYDYNTIKAGGVMKCYNFNTLSYIGDTAVNIILGNLYLIGFASSDSTLGFEEMINNVEISCSPYMNLSILKPDEVKKENLERLMFTDETEEYKIETFARCSGWERIGNRYFDVYTNKDNDNTIAGANITKATPDSPGVTMFKLKTKETLISTPGKYFLRLKLQCFVNVRSNPFDTNEKVNHKAVINVLYANLYTVDNNGTPLYYFDNGHAGPSGVGKWVKCENGVVPPGLCYLTFCQSDLRNTDILNTWVTNSNYKNYNSGDVPEKIPQKEVGIGLLIPINSTIYGTVVLELRDKYSPQQVLYNNASKKYWLYPIYMGDNPTEIKDVLVNNLQISICDDSQKDIQNLDCEFKSYINKKVTTDFKEKDLKVVSCNEEQIPVGKGCILALKNGLYNFQLKFTRAGQTDILERLLMCTIHSNYTTKNRVISVDIKMTENPAMRYVTYDGIIDSDGMIVKGCSLDFDNAVTRITAADFSADTVTLSNLPYDE